MTLVPIIYTSLLIFSALFIFVIIVSFISFKIKSRSGGYDRREYPLNLQPVHTHVQNPVINRNYELEKSRLLNDYRVKQEIAKVQQQHRIIKVTQDVKKDDPVPRSESYQQFANPNIQKEKRRIEIMNTSQRNYSFKNDEGDNRNLRSTSNLTDLNLLSYYSDLGENKLIHLSTPGIGRA